MISETLTGEIRYRVSRFRQKLILQVEVRRHGYDYDYYLDAYDVNFCYWRDANPQELFSAKLNK